MVWCRKLWRAVASYRCETCPESVEILRQHLCGRQPGTPPDPEAIAEEEARLAQLRQRLAAAAEPKRKRRRGGKRGAEEARGGSDRSNWREPVMTVRMREKGPSEEGASGSAGPVQENAGDAERGEKRATVRRRGRKRGKTARPASAPAGVQAPSAPTDGDRKPKPERRAPSDQPSAEARTAAGRRRRRRRSSRRRKPGGAGPSAGGAPSAGS